MSSVGIHRQQPVPGISRPRVIATALLAAVFIILMLSATAHAAHAGPRGAKPARPGAALRVCADPNDLPFSNQAREGFENKLADMVGKALGEYVEYDWWPQRQHFVKDTLDAYQCDVIMGWATGSDAVFTTDPYYRSAYALVYRQSAPYDVRSLDSPLLKKLKIGVHSIGDDWEDLPGGAVLAKRGIVRNVRVYTLYQNYGRANPSSDLIKAVADGDVDVAIAWGPLAGYFAPRQKVKLKVVPLVHTHAILPFQFSISMAVRRGDTRLRDKLNRFLQQHRKAIHALLVSYNIPLLPLDSTRQPPRVAAAR
ncbi:MAG TPA: quinoprotein dehydrogenase-associated putative ABC transporter substrate-binding protein [Gammaproteobacteria bacterium]|nr:quinoprotein dehydrogenase-associated putative ABC transporter substrate-binding protein [Gammaproteobacteria bacterium]